MKAHEKSLNRPTTSAEALKCMDKQIELEETDANVNEDNIQFDFGDSQRE